MVNTRPYRTSLTRAEPRGIVASDKEKGRGGCLGLDLDGTG